MSVYATPIPGAVGSGGYAEASLGATTAYQNALARINQKRVGTLQQNGYQGDVNPTSGVIDNIRVDPYNQFGGLQQMLRGQAQEDQSAAFNAQERGLQGGLANQLVSQARYSHGAQSADFGRQLVDTLGGYQDEQNQAAYSRDSALYQAEQIAAQNAINQQAFNPADFSGLTYPGFGDNTPTTDPSGYTTGGVGPGTQVNPPAKAARNLKSMGGPKQQQSANAQRLVKHLVASRVAARRAARRGGR